MGGVWASAGCLTRLLCSRAVVGGWRRSGRASTIMIMKPDILEIDSKLAELVRHLRRHTAIGSSALTTAELRVLHYLPTNLSLAEIGNRLFVSRYTVKTHCGSIYRKLNVNSRSEAVEAARTVGLLEPDL